MLMLYVLIMIGANGGDTFTNFADKKSCEAAAAWVNERESSKTPRAACFSVQ
jgi:hypothetical protein